MSEGNVPPFSTETRPAQAVDEFIGELMPAWLRRASPAQINRLRQRFTSYRDSQQALRKATVDLVSLQAFAREKFQAMGQLPMSAGTLLADLEWLLVTPRFERIPGTLWPLYGPAYHRQPGLLRLMQNFEAGARFFDGSGLVSTGSYQVLSGKAASLAKVCRELDVGKQYQALLTQVFGEHTRGLLMADKRDGLKLVCEIAALKGEISAFEKSAIDHLADGSTDYGDTSLYGTGSLLDMLGSRVADALVIELWQNKQAKGLILYLPSHPTLPVQRFASTQEMNTALVKQLKEAGGREYFAQLIGLDQRAAFLTTLDKRLNDPLADLQLALTVANKPFNALVEQQIKRIANDARQLLVPSADADAKAAKARVDSWKRAGMLLVNLAGFFDPVVGALLLGQLVAQTVSEVYEGIDDWAQGHRHEALEHLLGVAETLAVTAAVAGGASIVARGFTRSDFVDGLTPVRLDDGSLRLWRNDLKVYEDTPDAAQLKADGLFGQGEQRWVRLDGAYYRVHRPRTESNWYLRHPLRPAAYGPALQGNGERGWRLWHDRPLEWQGSARMLDALWPGEAAWTAEAAAQVLTVAGVDQDELRGLLVENRRVPVNLRETLRRYQARQRIEAFFTDLAAKTGINDDKEIQAWCLARPGMASKDGESLRRALLSIQAALREPLLAYLTRLPAEGDELSAMLRRDFPALPEGYAQEAVADAEPTMRALAKAEGKVPLSIAGKARTLLQMAKLSLAVEGLYADGSYSDDTGKLALALFERLADKPATLRLELRKQVGFGQLLATVAAVEEPVVSVRLVDEGGSFRVYDENLDALGTQPQEPRGILEAIVAALSTTQREALGLGEGTAVAELRSLLLAQLPGALHARKPLLGWQPEGRWFNPGKRLPDGRVGYLLSGRGQGRRQLARDRLRALYPSLDDQQLEDEFQRLRRGPGSLYSQVGRLEDDYQQLDVSLNRWVSAELNEARGAVRRRFAERVRRAWRLQGEPVQGEDGQLQGLRLSLSGLRVTTLPELPGHVSFPRITALVMTETPVSIAHTDFLRAFSALRELNLSRNQLRQVPQAIAYLVHLRRLRLAYNDIRLDLSTLECLRRLPQLTHLDLSYNPLGAYYMRYDQLPHLLELNLRQCRLGAWPAGIELCGFLERIDLRDNQLNSVPATVLQMPHAYRRAFLVTGNDLKRLDLGRLYALDTIQEHRHLPEPLRFFDPALTRKIWLAGADQTTLLAREQRWDTLAALPNSNGLFRLLGYLRYTLDFSQAREQLDLRVWRLLDAVHENSTLREQLYSLADTEPSCENGAADLFARLQVRMEVDIAERNTLHERGEVLLTLGRGLVRLERVELAARQDIRGRIERRDDFEPLTVSLAYRVQLRQRLGLPGQPHSMRYTDEARVSDAQLAQVVLDVRAAETPQVLAAGLSQQRFWQLYLQERHAAAFDVLEQQHAGQRTNLVAQIGPLEEHEDEPLVQALRVAQASERLQLVQQLTEQLLYGRERGQG